MPCSSSDWKPAGRSSLRSAARCERCERSVVYLSPRERAGAAESGQRVYGNGGGSRLNRQGCRCPFYLGPSQGCAAYEDRPLICNLFPLDIIEREEDGQYWWVLFGACEEVARGKLAGRIEEARELAREIDRRMPDDLKQAFMADAGAALFEPVFYEHPIHFLVPLSLKQPSAVSRQPSDKSNSH